MVIRIMATALIAAAYWAFQTLFLPQATLIAAKQAGGQFEASDEAYTNFMYTIGAIDGIGWVVSAIVAVILLAIWWSPLSKIIKEIGKEGGAAAVMVAVMSGALLLTQGMPARAFFSKTDRTEVVPILPNQSAFWIPDVGDNKTSQKKFDSEAYLNESKVALKRFIVPHQKLRGSAGKSMFSGYDYYVPAGRLVIVDRTPYSREWVDDADRGTSTKREGFPCQSVEGLNIKVGISIGTSVTEENAAKFLFRFGVKPPKGELTGNLEKDGPIIFTSVYHGRSLQEVMDDVGRKKVQTIVCNEIGKRTFDAANKEMQAIMAATEKAVKMYFIGVGITLDFIGWGDSYQFDPAVQKVVNDRYAAQTLKPMLPILQALAKLQIQEGLGQGFAKHGAPVVVTPEMVEALTNMVKAAPAVAGALPTQ